MSPWIDLSGSKNMALVMLVLLITVVGCGSEPPASPEVKTETVYRAKDVADAVYSVVAAHRKIYSERVVDRLAAEGVISAHEDFAARQALLLPAQLFRFSAEEANTNNVLAKYQLKSLWPINADNAARTDLESQALNAVANDPTRAFHGEETLAGVRHHVAVYADLATSQVCVDCHNAHPNSPRRDFHLNEVMGGVIVKIPLD